MLGDIAAGLAAEGFFDRLADDVIATEMDSISPDYRCCGIETGRGTLLFADR